MCDKKQTNSEQNIQQKRGSYKILWKFVCVIKNKKDSKRFKLLQRKKKTKTDYNFKICKVLDVIKLEWICSLCERVGIRLYPNPGNTGILSVLI